MNDRYIRVLTVYYDTEISNKEIPFFRGAVLKSLGDKADLLFHNHVGEDKFRYAYPCIQYKRLGGKAAIVCVEEGVDVIGQFLAEFDGTLILGNRVVRCESQRLFPTRVLMQTWKQSFHYHLYRWLPLNSKNYQAYRMTDDENERMRLLERVLAGNLLSMLKSLNIYLEDELLVRITKVGEPYITYNKGIALMTFNVDFASNLSIPNNVGVGKNASIGYGVIHQIKERKESI